MVCSGELLIRGAEGEIKDSLDTDPRLARAMWNGQEAPGYYNRGHRTKAKLNFCMDVYTL